MTPRRHAGLARLWAAVAAALTLFALPASGQGWERTYTLTFSECTQQSLLSFGEAIDRFPGLIASRPQSCGPTNCTYQYISRMAPNPLLQSLYAMVDGLGYRANIGVEGLRYAILCLPGKRRHPLEAEPRAKGFTEYETACGSVIDAAGDVLFDYDRAGIREDAAVVLGSIARRIQTLRPIAVEITGHTDSRGSAGYNQGLSERRAASVAAYFAGPLRVAGPQFLTRGLGESQPRRPNRYADGSDNPIGRQANRRVEIFLRTVSGDGACRPVQGPGPGFQPYGAPRQVDRGPVYQYRKPAYRYRAPKPKARPLDPAQW